MDFGPYETFSVLSGIVLSVGAAMPGMSGRERLALGTSGPFFLVYGLYVASQTTGTWEFPVQIFVLPFVGIGLIAYRFAVSRRPVPTPQHDWGPIYDPGPDQTGAYRCLATDCQARLVRTDEQTCRRCGGRNQLAPPLNVFRGGVRTDRWCAESGCAETKVPTSNLVCQACRTDTVLATT